MLNAEKAILKCPDCGAELTLTENKKSLVCNGTHKHCFDIASDGYVNLTHTSGSGDSKEAVAARKNFLDTGYYKPLSDAVCEMLRKHINKPCLIADMGCGDGYYSVNVAARFGVSIFGADLSKFAARAAAKRSKALGVAERTLYSVASVFEAPLKNDSCDAVMNLFAPCAENEFLRILKPGGILILVGAGKNHLLRLKEMIYDVPRLNDERKDLPEKTALVEKRTLSYRFTPDVNERDALFTMTPYYYKTSLSDKEKLRCAPISEIGAEFDIYVYKKAK